MPVGRVGKTHVACLVVAEVLQQLKEVYADHRLNYKKKPAL